MAEGWRAFGWSQISSVQPRPGVLELCDGEKMTVYIGSSENVRRSLEEFFRDPRSCVRQFGKLFRVEYCRDYRRHEKIMVDLFRDVFGKDPMCNELLAHKSVQIPSWLRRLRIRL